MRKKVKGTFNILIIFMFLFASTLFAKANSGSFSMIIPRDESGNSFALTLEVNYTIDILMEEPVLKAQAKFKVGELISIDGSSYTKNEFSQETIAKLKIYDLKLQIPFITEGSNKILYIDADMGSMGKEGEWSYNTPGSPEWDHWLYYIVGFEKVYLNKEDAIKAYKGFQKLEGFPSASVKSIRYDVSAAKKGKKEKELEDMFSSVEEKKRVDENSLEDIFGKAEAKKAIEKTQTYFHLKTAPIKEKYEQEFKECSANKPSYSDNFFCSKPLLTFTTKKFRELPYEEQRRINQENDRYWDKKCAEEKREWEQKRREFPQLLARWEKKRENCEKLALKTYNDAMHKFEQNEKNIESFKKNLDFK